MNTIFADTVFYVALLNPRDPYSPAAIQLAREHGGRYLTTTLVLTEVANFVSASRWRSKASELIQELQESTEVDIIHADDVQWMQSVRLYSARSDKQWSLTDCLSFVVMNDRQIQRAATADHHFEQAGFEILLKP